MKLKEVNIKKYKGLWLLVKASMSSQVSSWFDMLCSFVFFSLFSAHTTWSISMCAFRSTAIGAFAGGILNCIINYKWTFHAQGMSKVHVAIKFAMVWTGSFLLNSFGTSYFTGVCSRWTWLRDMGLGEDAIFGFARISVSLVVSIFWNLLLQRYFVYRRVDLRALFKKGKKTEAEQ